MNSHYTIFYSWQSDLSKETNQVAIRHCLNEAKNKVEADLVDVRIDLDEATRNTAGSPDIANTIFEKIEACDIFVCDLTTINSDTTDKRPVPNPNVLIELGYAIATIGWDRILMLFNKFYGDFSKDLPFDINRRRVTPFTIKDKNDKSGKGQLTTVLQDAIKTIIGKCPLRPIDRNKISPEQRKRELDVKNLNLILSTIHIPTVDSFIEGIPDKFLFKSTAFYYYFKEVMKSSTFFIYDQELSNRIYLLGNNWSRIQKFLNYYFTSSESNTHYVFRKSIGMIMSDKEEIAFDEIERLKIEFMRSFKDLLKYVRLNYIEIDIDKLSDIAHERYNKGVSIE